MQDPQLVNEDLSQLLLFCREGSEIGIRRISFVLLKKGIEVNIVNWLAQLHRELYSILILNCIVTVHTQEGRTNSQGTGQFCHEDFFVYFIKCLGFCFLFELNRFDGIGDPSKLERIQIPVAAFPNFLSSLE